MKKVCRHSKKVTVERPFFGCVSTKCNPASHGGVVFQHICTYCGKSKLVAANNGHKEESKWS